MLRANPRRSALESYSSPGEHRAALHIALASLAAAGELAALQPASPAQRAACASWHGIVLGRGAVSCSPSRWVAHGQTWQGDICSLPHACLGPELIFGAARCKRAQPLRDPMKCLT